MKVEKVQDVTVASKKVRVIEDLVKQKRDFTKENEYKSLVPFLSNETKKRFENAIAKIKAEKKKAIIIYMPSGNGRLDRRV